MKQKRGRNFLSSSPPVTTLSYMMNLVYSFSHFMLYLPSLPS